MPPLSTLQDYLDIKINIIDVNEAPVLGTITTVPLQKTKQMCNWPSLQR